MEDLRRKIEEGRTSGKRAYLEEYQLLHTEQLQGKLTNNDYDKQLEQIYLDHYKDLAAHKLPPGDDPASDYFNHTYSAIARSTSPEDKERTKKIHEALEKGMHEIDKDYPE